MKIASCIIARSENQKTTSITVRFELSHEQKNAYLRLKQRTFKKHQGLPFEFMNEFSKRQTEVIVHLPFLVFEKFGQALLKALQNVDVREISGKISTFRCFSKATSQHTVGGTMSRSPLPASL
jgi:hypothetical protein